MILNSIESVQHVMSLLVINISIIFLYYISHLGNRFRLRHYLTCMTQRTPSSLRKTITMWTSAPSWAHIKTLTSCVSPMIISWSVTVWTWQQVKRGTLCVKVHIYLVIKMLVEMLTPLTRTTCNTIVSVSSGSTELGNEMSLLWISKCAHVSTGKPSIGADASGANGEMGSTLEITLLNGREV